MNQRELILKFKHNTNVRQKSVLITLSVWHIFRQIDCNAFTRSDKKEFLYSIQEKYCMLSHSVLRRIAINNNKKMFIIYPAKLRFIHSTSIYPKSFEMHLYSLFNTILLAKVNHDFIRFFLQSHKDY